MARQRLTNETLSSARRLASAQETIRLAENLLGRGAADKEVLATARALQRMSPEEIRQINKRRATITSQTRRLAADPDGAADVLEESGPRQPDPTNNQAYVKQIMTSPDHAVLDSLTKKSLHTPTATRGKLKKRRAADEDVDVEASDEDTGVEASDEDTGIEAADETMDDAGEIEEPGDDEDMDDAEEEDMDESDEFDLEEDDADLESMMNFSDDHPEPDDDDFGGPADDDEDDVSDVFDAEDSDEPEILHEPEDEEEGEPEGETDDVVDEGLMPDEEPDLSPMVTPTSSRRPKRPTPNRKEGRQAKAPRFTLEDILDFDDDGSIIAAQASTELEGDDLEALIGKKSQARNRSASARGFIPKITESSRQEGYTWDTENEPEMGGVNSRQKTRRASADMDIATRTTRKTPKKQPSQSPPKKRVASQPTQFSPDRRRIASVPNSSRDPFESVFGVPNVEKFFQD